MQKDYKTKELKSEDKVEKSKKKQRFFFPKANPAVTIEAENVEEAEKIISNLKNK